jgi:hypothetical protein
MKGAIADPSAAITWTSRLLAAEYIQDCIAEGCKKPHPEDGMTDKFEQDGMVSRELQETVIPSGTLALSKHI